MEYMRLDPQQREALLSQLDEMPSYLREVFAGLTAEQARTPPSDGSFSPVEQVWHLADLEREGFGLRIHRLLTEDEPRLPDFDGGQIAVERNYRSLSVEDGLQVFALARAESVALLRRIDPPTWWRPGTQEGVGRVTLCDMPGFMAQHDAAHREEIEEWRRAQQP